MLNDDEDAIVIYGMLLTTLVKISMASDETIEQLKERIMSTKAGFEAQELYAANIFIDTLTA